MKLTDITEAKKEPIKARDPNWRDMEALRKSGMEDQFQAYMQEAQEPGEYRTISGVKYYIVKNKSGKSKAFSGPTPAAKKYAQTGGNWYDEDVNEADPDTLGSMNDKMRDVLSKVDTDDKAQAQAAKDKAEAERQAKAKELGPQAMDDYIARLKAHDWTYDYSDDHRVWSKGRDQAGEIRRLGDILDPDRKIYKKYSPFSEQVEEKISKSDDMGDVIKDFYKSDAPQFKGKSKEKRRQMAIAAKLSAESSDIFKALEQVDEDIAVTSASDIAVTVSPHIAIGDKKTRKKYGLTGGLPNPPKAKRIDPKDNALDMKGTSIFGGPLKR